jgi:hypothetical protein
MLLNVTYVKERVKMLCHLSYYAPYTFLNQKWKQILMGFIERLPMFDGKDKYFVMVDRLTKYAHFMGERKRNCITNCIVF